MTLQDFTTELQAIIDENISLKQKIDRYEFYLKKLLFDQGGKIDINPFKDKQERLEIESYKIAFGVTTIELV